MAIDLSEDDHDLMDRYLKAVFARFLKTRDTTEAVEDIARIMTHLALDKATYRDEMLAAIEEIEEE